MKKNQLTLVLILITIAPIYGQSRYVNKLFEEVQKSTEIYFQKDRQSLEVDIFQPVVDTATKRPLLLYVHGGGFSGGSRDLPNHHAFCIDMAQRGYVTATMSYTLVMKGKSFGCDRPAPEKIKTFLYTAQDISRATRYFIDNSEMLRIDTSKIVLLGSSAGAEAVLHAAYWKETYLSDSSHIIPEHFRYGAVVSMAGALTQLDWITTESAIPTLLFHGTCDNLVPYGHAPHHYCDVQDPGFLMLYGAYSITEKLRQLGKSYFLMTGCYGRHEWNDKPIKQFQEKIAYYVHRSLYGQEIFHDHEIIDEGQSPCPDYHSYNFCSDQ